MNEGETENGAAAADEARRLKRRRRTMWLLGLLSVSIVGLVAYCVTDRRLGPRGVPVVSLRSLADRGAGRVRIWPAEGPRSVYFVARDADGRMLTGVAGPAGLVTETADIPPDADPVDMVWGWHGDSIAYRSLRDGALYLKSPHSAPPRKVTDGLLPPSRRFVGWTWAPAGNRIAAAIGDPQGNLTAVAIYSRDGTPEAEVPLTSPPGPVMDLDTLWSPAGERLLVRYRIGSPPGGMGEERELVLSAPKWRPVRRLRYRAPRWQWADHETLVAVTQEPWFDGISQLHFVRALTGEEVAQFDCGQVSVGGPRAVTRVGQIQLAPSGAGILASCLATSTTTVALARGVDRWPRGLASKARRRVRDAVPLTAGLAGWRVAHVYVPVTGEGLRIIAIDERGDFFCAVSSDGTELLYVSDWELKAAPLPAEARGSR